MTRTTYAFALLAAVAALAVTGCGGGGSSSESSGSEAAASTTAAAGSTVDASEVSGLGNVLVDSEGMTVYEFTVDNGTTSECYEECEAAWPPVTTSGKPTAGGGASAADLGTTKRKDGTEQVTYKGHPLYTFAADKAPGEANGNESEGTWFVLNEAGTAVKGQATAAASEGEPAGGESEEAAEEGSGGAYGY